MWLQNNMPHLHCFPKIISAQKVKSEVAKWMAGSSHHSMHLNSISNAMTKLTLLPI